MISKLRGLRIRTKLLAGFGALLLFVAILGGVAYNGIRSNNDGAVYLQTYPQQRFVELLGIEADMQMLRHSVTLMAYHAGNESAVRHAYAAARDAEQSFIFHLQAYIANLEGDPRIIDDTREHLLGLTQSIAIQAHIFIATVLEPMYHAALANSPETTAILDTEAANSENIAAYFYYLLNAVQVSVENLTAGINAEAARNQVITIIATIVILFLGLGVALFMASHISRPIVRLQDRIRKVASGNTNIAFNDKEFTDDEIGQLTEDTAALVSTISGLVTDISTFTHKNMVDGDLQYRPDPSKYSGAYQEMLASLNAFTDDFSDGVIMLLNAVDGINAGVFKHELRKLPGQKIWLNNTADALMTNLEKVTADITGAIEAAQAGDLKYHIDTTKYDGEWKEMMEGLNDVFKAIEAPLFVIETAATEMSKGNVDLKAIDEKITKAGYKADPEDFQGAYRRTIKAFDTTIQDYEHSLGTTIRLIGEIAEGDLRSRIHEDWPGDFMRLKNALNNIFESLTAIVEDIRAAAQQVASGSTQMSTSANDLASGAQEQASSVEELVSTIDVINEQVRNNADQAANANRICSDSADAATEGNSQMKQLAAAMGTITDATSNITKINRTINDITFQTNLLSLNASVEAARAGEHGKGFAVVADEVRSLAQRSQAATTETESVLEQTNASVQAGNDLTKSTAESLEEISAGAGKTLDAIQAIANACEEQAHALQQITVGLQQISQITQSNSATSEETAAASQELSSQAELLSSLVARFKI